MFSSCLAGCGLDAIRQRRNAHKTQSATQMTGQHGSRFVVEFVGLPGAGKTTVAGHFPKDWLQRRHVTDARVPVSWRVGLYRASWRFFLSLRPRHENGVHRFWRLADQLIYYTSDFGPLVLDQGIVQKIWSQLVWREEFDRRELERIVDFLTPLSPDVLVWMKTPVEDAVQRIVTRSHGRSRFDNRHPGDIRDELAREMRNFELLTELFGRSGRTKVLEISGHEAPSITAAKVLAQVAEMASRRGSNLSGTA